MVWVRPLTDVSVGQQRETNEPAAALWKGVVDTPKYGVFARHEPLAERTLSVRHVQTWMAHTTDNNNDADIATKVSSLLIISNQ